MASSVAGEAVLTPVLCLAGHRARLLVLYNNPMRKVWFYSRFTGEETEAQRS